jgi:hypothetical protein
VIYLQLLMLLQFHHPSLRCAESLKDLHSDNEDDDSQGEHTIDAGILSCPLPFQTPMPLNYRRMSAVFQGPATCFACLYSLRFCPDEADHVSGGIITKGNTVSDAIRRDRGIDSSWMRSSMTEDGANCFQYQQLCVVPGLLESRPASALSDFWRWMAQILRLCRPGKCETTGAL